MLSSEHRKRITRVLSILAIVAFAANAAWYTWPHPALEIAIARGGHAEVVSRLGARTPLADTVRISGQLPATVVIENADTAMHHLGMFGVAKGERQTFTITQPGTYSGYCSAHPARAITYIVSG